MATQEITNLTSEIKLLEGKIEGKQRLIEFLQQELDIVPASKFQKTQMLYDLRLRLGLVVMVSESWWRKSTTQKQAFSLVCGCVCF